MTTTQSKTITNTKERNKSVTVYKRLRLRQNIVENPLVSQNIEEKIKKEMKNQKEQIKKEELRKEKKITQLWGFGYSKIPFKNNKKFQK